MDSLIAPNSPTTLPTRFSQYGQASSVPSPVSRMMAAFAGNFRDGVDINLGVGYVNERTIPAGRMVEALAAVTGDPLKYRQAFNYGGPAGSANLVESIRRFLAARGTSGLEADVLARKRLVIGPSGATSILDALADVLAPGIVITSDPMYYIYCDVLERKGFEVVAVPEDGEGIDLAALERKLAGLGARVSEIAFFYVVTINNPSCTILSNARRRALAAVAARLTRQQGRRVPIFFDLAYEMLLHDPEGPALESALGADELEIVYEIGTLSKVLAPALRVGYLLGPAGGLIDALVQRTSDVGFSAPLFAQEMASWLLDHCVAEQVAAVNEGYREKALAVRAGIERALGPLLEDCTGGRAGFYFYLTFKAIETHTGSAFFRFLARTTGEERIDRENGALAPRVVYVPGEYCVHPRGERVAAGRRQLRLSYGFEEVPAILKALALMRAAGEYALGMAGGGHHA